MSASRHSELEDAVQDYTLEITRRSETGAAANRRIRREGYIPSVVYQRGEESVSATVVLKDFTQKAQTAKGSQIFRIKSNDRVLDGKAVIVREIQKDYTKGRILHIDFQALRENEEIVLKIALQVQGEAPGVKSDGGILSMVSHEIAISCLPKDIPDVIVVDVSNLHLGQSLHAKDLVLPAGVTLVADPDETIASVVTQRSTIEETAATAEGAAAAATTDAAAATPAAAAPAKGK